MNIKNRSRNWQEHDRRHDLGVMVRVACLVMAIGTAATLLAERFGLELEEPRRPVTAGVSP